MSEIKVNKISPRTNCGTVQLGDSGDTITIPAGATITNSGTANGFGADGAVNWQTSIKTATFTAANQEGYFCNTSGGAFTVNLPAGSAGNIIAIKDYAGTFQTNNLTITPNGSDKIDNVNGDATISTENAAIVLVFADSTRGWLNVNDSTNVEGASFITATGGTITTVCTNFKVHTFTGPGTFCVSAGNGPLAKADYLVVAGGGGGGTGMGGGGGAGGFREAKVAATSGCWTASPLAATSSLTLSPGPYSIVVGAGGAGGAGSPGVARCGHRGNSSSFSSITSTGGGGGGGNSPYACFQGPGGSGGGAVYNSLIKSPTVGGVGNTPPVNPSQGFPGGAGSNPVGAGNPSGPPCAATTSTGGGGATAAGGDWDAARPAAGPGGAGATTSINATPTTYAGGGGGVFNTSGAPGPGGAGGGGAGGPGPSGGGGAGVAGTANTGGGGGAAGDPVAAGNGGSGIVIIRYKFQ